MLLRIFAIFFFLQQLYKHQRLQNAQKDKQTSLTLILIAMSITGSTIGISIETGCSMARVFTTIESGTFCDDYVFWGHRLFYILFSMGIAFATQNLALFLNILSWHSIFKTVEQANRLQADHSTLRQFNKSTIKEQIKTTAFKSSQTVSKRMSTTINSDNKDTIIPAETAFADQLLSHPQQQQTALNPQQEQDQYMQFPVAQREEKSTNQHETNKQYQHNLIGTIIEAQSQQKQYTQRWIQIAATYFIVQAFAFVCWTMIAEDTKVFCIFTIIIFQNTILGGVFIIQYIEVYKRVKQYHLTMIKTQEKQMNTIQAEILNRASKEILKFFVYVSMVLIAQFIFKVCELINEVFKEEKWPGYVFYFSGTFLTISCIIMYYGMSQSIGLAYQASKRAQIIKAKELSEIIEEESPAFYATHELTESGSELNPRLSLFLKGQQGQWEFGTEDLYTVLMSRMKKTSVVKQQSPEKSQDDQNYIALSTQNDSEFVVHQSREETMKLQKIGTGDSSKSSLTSKAFDFNTRQIFKPYQ
ncbi:hypothetical protein FGO68_gene807 [Halteria grandinella]|uniref:Uncharacterized protein n=1 Tax=Halteria grandinella TaxID=5974 RepID=A0A8J8T3R8_HALGN|nr:hypothetical protein FGO68_gene807 [Halteria grandinella]